MPTVDFDQAVATGLEVKELILQHWIAAVFGAIALYLLKNKYGNGLNGVPGPFLAAISPADNEVYDRIHPFLQIISS
jgi:hypothetical protein